MQKLTFIGLFFIAVALISAPAFAKRHAWTDIHSDNSKPTERIEKLKRRLDLTPDQEAAIREIIIENRKKTDKQRDLKEATREEVRELMNADTLNKERLRELLHAQAEQRLVGMASRYETRTAINQLLTPEQQEKSQLWQQIKRDRKGFRRCTSSGNGVRAM